MSHHTDIDLEARLAASYARLDIQTPPFRAPETAPSGSWRLRRYALLSAPVGLLLSAKGSFAAAGLAGKIAIATAGTVAVFGTAIGVKTAVTGSPNPTSWGQTTVVPAVQSCKAAIASPRPTGSANGIGECVSDVAQQHGAAQSSANAQSGANHGNASNAPGQSGTSHGNSGNAPGHSGTHGNNGNNGNNGKGQSSSHPTPPVPTPAHPTPH